MPPELWPLPRLPELREPPLEPPEDPLTELRAPPPAELCEPPPLLLEAPPLLRPPPEDTELIPEEREPVSERGLALGTEREEEEGEREGSPARTEPRHAPGAAASLESPVALDPC